MTSQLNSQTEFAGFLTTIFLTRWFPVRIHDDFSGAARFHEREGLGELFQRKPMSNHLRQIDLSRLQHFRSLVPCAPQPSPEDAPDMCIFEYNPVGHVELNVL